MSSPEEPSESGEKKGSRSRPLIIATLFTTLLVAIAGGFGGKLGEKFFNFTSEPPKVTLSAVEQLGQCINSFIFKKPMSRIPVWKEPMDWVKWGKSHGGVVSDFSIVAVNIAGGSESQVTITGIRFFVTKRHRPIKGSIVKTGCGGPVEGVYVEVDLDKKPPSIVSSSSVAAVPFISDERVKPISFPWAVTNVDTMTLYVIAGTRNYHCLWRGEVDWQSGESHGTLSIDNGGKPFEVSSPSRSRVYSVNDKGEWETDGSRAKSEYHGSD